MGVADRTADGAAHDGGIAEAFLFGVNLDFARSQQPRSGGEGEPMAAPVGFAVGAGGDHFQLVSGADAEGGAVVFVGAVFQDFAAGDEVAHDSFLGVHAEEGAAGGDGGVVAAHEGGEGFGTFGRSMAVGLGGVVGEADADEGVWICEVDGGDVERDSGDRAAMDGDGAGSIGVGDLEGAIGGEGEGGIGGGVRSVGVRGGWGAGYAARTGGGEGDVSGEIAEEEKGESGDRKAAPNHARLGVGSVAGAVAEGGTAGRSSHAGKMRMLQPSSSVLADFSGIRPLSIDRFWDSRSPSTSVWLTNRLTDSGHNRSNRSSPSAAPISKTATVIHCSHSHKPEDESFLCVG